jgi:hypothetical protein
MWLARTRAPESPFAQPTGDHAHPRRTASKFMNSARCLTRLAATVLACSAPITVQAQVESPPSESQAASSAKVDALAPAVAKTLQKTVTRAARQMAIMGQVLERMSNVDRVLEASLREEFFSAYVGTLRVEPVLRISAGRTNQFAPPAPGKTDALALAAAAYADACADLRALHGVVLAKGEHGAMTTAANAKVREAANVLQQAARNLAAVTDRSDT